MNQSPNQEKSWDESLRMADPFRQGTNDAQQKSQILEKITMNKDRTDVADRPDLLDRAAASRKKTRRLARPMAAMVAAGSMVAVSLLGYSLLSAPSASAQMLEAAQNSVDAEEGEITVTAELEVTAVDGSEIDPELASELGYFEGDIDFAFEGEDYRFVASLDDGTEAYEPQARFVDGELYISETGESWLPLGVEESDAFAELAADNMPGVQNFSGDALEQLVLITDDIAKTEQDGVTTYTGTVEAEKILALGMDELPAVLLPFKLAGNREASLPMELKVEMTIVDGEAEVITISVDGFEVDGVIVSGTVTTDYSGVGEPQAIEAPPANLIETP